jgi:hypothetical protein
LISDAILESLSKFEVSCVDEDTVPTMAFIKFKDDTVFAAVYSERLVPDHTSVAVFVWAISSGGAVLPGYV